MVRVARLIVILALTAAFVPHDKSQIAFVLNLPAPASERAAERSAEAFIRQKLDYPPNIELTFMPAMRAYLLPPVTVGLQPPAAAIWMCGTVRERSSSQTTTWLVAFDWKRPDLVHDGGFTRFTQGWCDEIYRDGILAFPR